MTKPVGPAGATPDADEPAATSLEAGADQTLSRPTNVHIAFFNRSYYPDQTATGQLLTELCEHLVRDHGCRVTVVAGLPLQPLPGRRRGHGSCSRETHHGVEILRARGTRFDKRRFAGRAANYVTYFLSACVRGLAARRARRRRRADRPADHRPGGVAGGRSRFRAPLVMAFQDVFPEVAVLMEDFHSPVDQRRASGA